MVLLKNNKYKIQRFVNLNFNANTYLITNKESDQGCYLIDVGNAIAALNVIKPNQYIKGIFLTHAHYDHIVDIHEVIKKFPNCSIYCSQYTKDALADSKLNLTFYHGKPISYSGANVIVIKERDEITLYSGLSIATIETPGHNEGCLSFKFQHYCFTGDALIPEVKVVTKLKSGNKEAAKQSIIKIQEWLDDTDIVLSGHGESFLKNEINWDYFK